MAYQKMKLDKIKYAKDLASQISTKSSIKTEVDGKSRLELRQLNLKETQSSLVSPSKYDK